MRYQSLRFKINAAITMTCVIVALIFSAIFYPYEMKHRDARMAEIKVLLSVTFEQNREDIANEIFTGHNPALNNSLNSMLSVQGISGVIVYDKNGRYILHSGIGSAGQLDAQDRKSLYGAPVFKKTEYEGHPFALFLSSIEVIGEHVGYMKIYYDLVPMDNEELTTVGVFASLLVFILIAMSLMLNSLLNRFVLRPTSLLRNAIMTLQNGEFGEQVPSITKDEIGEVAEAFNKMSSMLESQHNALKVSMKVQEKYAEDLQITNKALVQLNANLEDMVQERTSELKRSNELLHQEINERIQAENERKLLEERLIRSEKMEALGLLAGGVAHDLNNVLSGIVSYPDLILMELSGDDPLRRKIQMIRESGQKAADIVQDLLTLARRGVIQTSVIDLNQEIILEYLNSPEHRKILSHHPGISIETALSPELFKIKGSQIHLRKTLMNLIINAMEAQPKGGKITISTLNVYMETPLEGYEKVVEGDYVLLKIEDEGIGIDRDDITRIFEPFYTKKVMGRSGTGLGMAVVWGTVQDHNGYINVFSVPGKGSSFELYFSVTRDGAGVEKQAVHIQEYFGNREHILVVDDVSDQREIASSILEKLNYRVSTVASGEDALEFLKKNTADLILLDMIMEPGMDGLDTYKKIKLMKSDQKAVIASGYAENDRVREARLLGARLYVQKPYSIEKLGIAVKDELSQP